MRARAIVAAGVAALLAMACGGRPPQSESVVPAPPEAGWSELVRNGRVPLDGVLTGGQPTDEQLVALRSAGFTTVINLRQPGERGTQGEAERVAELGMRYVAIPVAGAEGLTEDNARALAAALEEAERPVLVHCGSGNRVGALLALKAFWVDGAGADEALAAGTAAGLTRLESDVRRILEAGG